MNELTLKAQWLKEEQTDFAGWDFSHLNGRWESAKLPWDYRQMVVTHLRPSDRLLDMGTGGGEFLLTLHHPYRQTAVTEAWPPNIRLIIKKLAPLGIHIYALSAKAGKTGAIPAPANSFNLIINQHAGFDIADVKRTLKPGGRFITQQVGAHNNQDLSKLLLPDYRPAYPHNTLKQVTHDLTEAGFRIERHSDYFPSLRFFDVGAVVYYAKIITWEFPGFSVDRCFATLLKLQKQIEQAGYIQTHEHRFLIIARK
ncbi:MAG: class I SAM-dependent methyltransferase [Sporolactobacillus sp.]|jgi:SAM-dependent methyltransferase|nr:class I SAM-dependent methyltransferase [Sporolactobacillus sp.]